MKASETARQHIAHDGPSVTGGEKIVKTITIARPPAEVYAIWRNFENLPRYMEHLDSVTVQNKSLSHWIVRVHENEKWEWDSELISDSAGEVISWRSLPGTRVGNAGSVWFKEAPAGRGTVVKLEIKYDPPGGRLGAALGKLAGRNAEELIEDDLFRFKCILETGEVPSTANQPQGNHKARRIA